MTTDSAWILIGVGVGLMAIASTLLLVYRRRTRKLGAGVYRGWGTDPSLPTRAGAILLSGLASIVIGTAMLVSN